MLSLLLLAAAAPVTVAEKSVLLDFRYGWSAEADAVPALRRRFRADASSQRLRGLATAREDRKVRLEMGNPARDWSPHSFEREWRTLGQTPRLLSLEGSTALYSGGAHGNSHTQRLIWDRRLGRELSIQALLKPGTSWQAAIHQPFCTLLSRERRKRLGPDQPGYDPGCPAYNDLPVSLVDTDRDRLFDHVRLTADPYVAGSYAEGEYMIELPITATMISRLRPDYRASFEAQPPVQ
ncbi:DUF3298 and DUF4163 domain-containing protein [Sphingomonas glaciei]|uniref:DUF3298 and DUF4163 domain-containing protein n=1 Tax=Sphingomonas glaciei TaxID=2938948 RepID=A0ABY5N0C9_9SPHN|nr:DUF3298 and DUF4163 domain-containing protein [Sphingomonas glaciei]UUR08763.1 DUF3298 and DUF4163 domain-containing protein [Sphingomonas glaciei]